MQPIIMQDWTTIRGASSATVVMSQADWIMTAPFQDIQFYLDIREITPIAGTITLNLETAPARDEALFKLMGAAAISITSSTPVTGYPPVTSFVLANATVPVSHWTRWKLVGPASLWDITFRIMAAGNSIG